MYLVIATILYILLKDWIDKQNIKKKVKETNEIFKKKGWKTW